jgi:hypothetical protein
LPQSSSSSHIEILECGHYPYAMSEGDWKHLGDLQLNQVLDPHTMNAPINPILDRARPYNHGAKPAGAGGGGFRMLLARDPEATGVLTRAQSQHSCEPGVVSYRIANEGLRVRTSSIYTPGSDPADEQTLAPAVVI